MYRSSSRGKVGQGIERYSVLRALRAIDRADVAVLLVDATEPLAAQDAHVAGFVQEHQGEAKLDAEEYKRVLHDELDRLPSRYRMPLMMHYFGGLRPEETAIEEIPDRFVQMIVPKKVDSH